MRATNPDLPILDELGAEFAALVDAEVGRARLPERRAPRRRGHGARRVARRSAVVLVLLCLVGGVALAARFGGGGDTPSHTSPTLLGKSASPVSRLSAYRDRGRLCLLFTVAGEVASECGAGPGRASVRASSLVHRGRRFVVGLAGPAVDSVAVRIGSAKATLPTRAADDPAAAAAAGVPAGVRWFVAAMTPQHLRDPALVTPLDRREQPQGPALLDCSLGVVGAACERLIRSRADDATP